MKIRSWWELNFFILLEYICIIISVLAVELIRKSSFSQFDGMYLCTWCMQSTLGSVTGKGRLNEIFIMCICLLLRQTTYSIATGPSEGLVWGARGNLEGMIYPLVDIELFKLI